MQLVLELMLDFLAARNTVDVHASLNLGGYQPKSAGLTIQGAKYKDLNCLLVGDPPPDIPNIFSRLCHAVGHFDERVKKKKAHGGRNISRQDSLYWRQLPVLPAEEVIPEANTNNIVTTVAHYPTL